MRRYIPQNGIIRDLTDDLSDTRDNVSDNLVDRIGLLIQPGSIKLDDDDSFKISTNTTGSVVCENIGPIRFPDGTIHAPETQASLEEPALPGEYYVVLSYDIGYSSAGDFVPGAPYPVETWGDNTLSQTRLSMDLVDSSSLTYSNTLKSVILYKIEKLALSLNILEDYRSSLGVSLPMTSFPLVPGEIPEVFISTIFGSDTGTSESQSALGESTIYDVDSFHVKEAMLSVQWKTAESAWFYEVEVIPYINSAPNPALALRDIKIDDGSEDQKSIIPIPSGQKVDISVTPFSHSILRERGPAISVEGFVVGSDRSSSSSSVTSSIESLNTMPSQYRFNVSVVGSTNCRVVITMTNSSGVFPIYRGRPGAITANVPAGTWTPRIKVYGIDGQLLDNEEFDPITVAATSTDTDTVAQMITLPINCEMDSTYWERSAAIFYAPIGAQKLVSATFVSNGSYLYASGAATQQPIIFKIASPTSEAGETILTIDDEEWPERQARTDTETFDYHRSFTNDIDVDIADGELYRINIITSDPSGTSPSLRLTGTLHVAWTKNTSGGV